MIINDIPFSADLEDILNELVSQLRLNDIHYIRKMIPTSRDVQICCPYHNNGMERRPSAGISKDTGIFHCFACDESFTTDDISFCERCGSLMRRDNEFPVCSNCIEYLEKE